MTDPSGGVPSLADVPEVDHLSLRLPTGQVSLGYVSEDDSIYVIARDRAARWPIEILREGRAQLDIGTRAFRGSVDLVVDPTARQRILVRFRAKYGEEGFVRWYQDPARVVRIRPGIRPADGDQYYAWLQSEFDNVADAYDRHILGNRINRLLRDRSLALLRATFPRGQGLLEIGCGSGMETLPLLRDGHEVFCVDISDRMLDVVRAKARGEGLSEQLRTLRAPAHDLGRLRADLGTEAFDGAYSTYGAMNCEADLRAVPPALYELLKPGGRFVAGVYNRWCAFELVAYALGGQWARAFGRASQPVRVGSSRFCVDVFSYSPATFSAIFAGAFLTESWKAAPVILPPSDLAGYAEKFARRFDRLDRWDRYLADRRFLRSIGDHFLMTLRRRHQPAA